MTVKLCHCGDCNSDFRSMEQRKDACYISFVLDIPGSNTRHRYITILDNGRMMRLYLIN